MTRPSRRERSTQVRRHILRVLLAGLATALVLGGCGSGSHGSMSGAANGPGAAAATGVWTAQDTSSADLLTLNSIAFVDATHGWAVGGSNEGPGIIVTSDGGTTWKAQHARSASSSATLFSVAFLDAAHGWAVGYDLNADARPTPLILATSDGGATWSSQDAGAAGTGTTLYSVSFADAEHGWVVGNTEDSTGNTTGNVILATRDGGATWVAQYASGSGPSSELSSVCFADATHGWAVGYDSRSV